MRDLTIELGAARDAFATLGEALGRAGINIEGGGLWSVEGRRQAHFLVADEAAEAARAALEAAGLTVLSVHEVLVTRLDQERPGALGRLARRLADAGVTVEVMYSDHAQQTILRVDDLEAARAVAPPPPEVRAEHAYDVQLEWTGNTGAGTLDYRSYRRDHRVTAPGKPELFGSSDPHFRGDAARWNPEELLVAALSACHLLSYLHVCADAGVTVTGYVDRPHGVMAETRDGGGSFRAVTLRPEVTVRAGADLAKAQALHALAHQRCFLAQSMRFEVRCEPQIRSG